MTPDDQTTPDLTALLAKHQRRLNAGGSCICGEWPVSAFGPTWIDHLAEQITAAGFGPVRAVQAERDAAVDIFDRVLDRAESAEAALLLAPTPDREEE